MAVSGPKLLPTIPVHVHFFPAAFFHCAAAVCPTVKQVIDAKAEDVPRSAKVIDMRYIVANIKDIWGFLGTGRFGLESTV